MNLVTGFFRACWKGASGNAAFSIILLIGVTFIGLAAIRGISREVMEH